MRAKDNSMKNRITTALALVAFASLLGATEPSADYRLKTGDVVSLSLGLADDASQARMIEVKVDRSGRVDLPVNTPFSSSLLVEASGKTVAELSKDVAGLLTQYSPSTTASFSTSVIPAAKSQGTATFCGEVQAVISLDLRSSSSVARAVESLKSGKHADLRRVQINRLNADGSSEMMMVNVEKIMRDGFQADVALKAGDIVYVPQSIMGGNPAGDSLSRETLLAKFTRLSFSDKMVAKNATKPSQTLNSSQGNQIATK